MAIIDKLKAKNGGFEGYLANERIDIELTIHKNQNAGRKEASPDYQVFTLSPRGRLVPIGGVWPRISRNKNEYLSLSVQIDGQTYNANAFPVEGEKDALELRPWSD